MAVTRISTHHGKAHDEALESVAVACRDLIWLAHDVAGGEHECGAANVDRHVEAVEAAVVDVIKLCETALGRKLVRPSLGALQAALTARMVENAAADLVDAPVPEPKRKPDLPLVRFDDEGRKL